MTSTTPDRQYYGEDARRALVQEFQIKPDNQTEFFARLESAARIWQSEVEFPFIPDVDWKEVSAFWRKIDKHSTILRDLIEGRHWIIDHRLTNSLESKHVNHAFAVMRAEEHGDPQPGPLELEPAELFQPYDLEVLSQTLSTLSDLAGKEIEILPKNRAGRKSDHALRLWMANMYTLWTERLGRKFSREVLDRGTPISPAARFVVEAFQPLDPNLPASSILTEMEKTIRTYRNRRP